MQRIAFFTAGTIGAGHLVHALAIERGLRRAGYTGDFHIFSPGVPGHIQAPPNLTALPIDMATLKSPTLARTSELAAALKTFDADILLIDMFWAPLLHITPSLRAKSWLLIRQCPPAWLRGPSFARFEPGRYQRLIAIEPLDHPLLKDQIEPIVYCNPDEMHPPGTLRKHLGLSDHQHLTVVMQAGLEGEIEAFSPPPNTQTHTHIFRSDPFHPETLIFPLAPWLHDANTILCGAGYNAFWEAKWLGHFDRTHFHAFQRLIDDQAWRLREMSHYTMHQNGADQLASMLLG